jgi:hypothetical protein
VVHALDRALALHRERRRQLDVPVEGPGACLGADLGERFEVVDDDDVRAVPAQHGGDVVGQRGLARDQETGHHTSSRRG